MTDFTDVPLHPEQMRLLRNCEEAVVAAQRELAAAIRVRDGSVAVGLAGVGRPTNVKLLGFDFEANTVRVGPPDPVP